MAVDDPRHLRIATLEHARVDELLDQLGGAAPDDVAAEQLAVALLAHQLHGSRAVAVHDAAADRTVLDLADDDVVALFPGFFLGQTEAADVWGAEGGARDVDVVDRV